MKLSPKKKSWDATLISDKIRLPINKMFLSLVSDSITVKVDRQQLTKEIMKYVHLEKRLKHFMQN